MNKASRQLILFHIFYWSHIIEWEDINSILDASRKTILRDIKQLKDSGIINVQYSKEEKGYIHLDESCHCPFLPPIYGENIKENMYTDKLIRLATIMIGLLGHEEKLYYEEGAKNQETCSSWYREKFPDKSSRTMQRDFKQLNEIGYNINYDRWDKNYIVDFPEYLQGIIDRRFL